MFNDYPRPAVAVDPAVLSVIDGEPYIVLWQRPEPPSVGEWALPGVFLNPTEGLEGAARRGSGTRCTSTRR